MRHHIIAAALALAASSAAAQPAPPPAPEPASADYQAGFCAGWRFAVNAEQTRFQNWRANFIGNAPPSTAFGVALAAVAQGFPTLVLLPPDATKFADDGKLMDCAPKPPPAPAAPPPAEGDK